MDVCKQILLTFGTVAAFYNVVNARYSEQSRFTDSYAQPKQKLPVILMHKQALSEDGAFNYAFAGDNGIKQGETIMPDGTRTGAYSYVDPDGETISVKYSAGKDGFKILQGDHVPRAPVVPGPSQAAPLHGSASQTRYTGPLFNYNAPSASSDETEDFGFGPTGSYSQYRGKINPNFKSIYRVHEDSSAEFYPQSGSVARIHDDAEEENKGPHSFGGGYSFEFGQSN